MVERWWIVIAAVLLLPGVAAEEGNDPPPAEGEDVPDDSSPESNETAEAAPMPEQSSSSDDGPCGGGPDQHTAPAGFRWGSGGGTSFEVFIGTPSQNFGHYDGSWQTVGTNCGVIHDIMEEVCTQIPVCAPG